MVENDEEAYWLKNLLLFTVECDHHCGHLQIWESVLI